MLENIIYSKILVTILSRNVHYFEKIHGISSNINHPLYSVSHCNSIKELGEHKTPDIIFLDDDSLQYIYDLKALFKDVPFILLMKDNPEKLLEYKQKGIVDCMDIDLMTIAGFNRCVINALEKCQIIVALSKQQQVLHKIASQHCNLTNEIIENEDMTNNDIRKISKDLLSENKTLIEIIQKQDQELKNISRHDPLTQMPNRLLFEETMTYFISHAKRYNHLLALLVIDVDNFSSVLNNYDSKTGNELLQHMASRLRKYLRSDDFIARIGDNRFTVVLQELKSTHAAGIVSWKLLQELQKPFFLKKHVIEITASIGIACYPYVSDTSSSMIDNAELALMRAKKEKNNYQYATISLQHQHLQTLHVESELKKALETEAFTILYQPVYDINENQLIAFEANLKWEGKNAGLVPLEDLISLAEDINIVNKLSLWLVDKVCEDVAFWKSQKEFSKKVIINLSPTQLANKNLLEAIYEKLQSHSILSHVIEFELTQIPNYNTQPTAEFNLTQHKELLKYSTQTSNLIEQIKYSNLPISKLKIDKTFIQQITVQTKDTIIIDTLLHLADKLNLNVIAEGVDTSAQVDFLKINKCIFAEGKFFSTAVIRENMLNFIRDHSAFG